MALYVKQDFTPPLLSQKWIAMKFRPNMLLYTRQHIISILESGLLFREDSIEVEQEAPCAGAVRAAAGGGWLTRGETLAAAAAVTGCVAVCPPRAFNRSTIFYLALYLSLPVAIRLAHRHACRGSLPTLLSRMRDYLTLSRRAAAFLRECAALRAELGSVSSAIESTRVMLCRQQSELAVTLSRASSALLGNAPWLRSDVAWDAVGRGDSDNLMKIHHAFLVVQSNLLKHIALAHSIPSIHAKKLYKNHNERLYWIHNTLITHLTEEFTHNYEALERMYRLLKNYGNPDTTVRRPGTAMNHSWLYTDVHSDIARANLELKLISNKCNDLDMFLDSCALNKQELDLEALNKDIDKIIGLLTKTLSTAQSSQIRLKKIMAKFVIDQPSNNGEDMIESERELLKIEDRDPIAKDEVFYFVKTDDDVSIQLTGDITTGPGKKEKDNTKIVLNELKRKLVKREDLMRERERQALAKTMPELKNNVPEFPRQNEEVSDKKGYISKLKLAKSDSKKRLFKKYLIQAGKHTNFKNGYRLQRKKYVIESDIPTPLFEANSKLNAKSKLVTVLQEKQHKYIIEWHKNVNFVSTSISENLSDVEGVAISNPNETVNLNNNLKQNGERNFKFTKRDLEMTPSSESESDFELYKERQLALLKDVRKHRTARRKNHADKRASSVSLWCPSTDVADESLRPVQYSFGAGLAMASVLQSSSERRGLAREEVFVGDGEVSEDSGNDEDA